MQQGLCSQINRTQGAHGSSKTLLEARENRKRPRTGWNADRARWLRVPEAEAC